MAADSTPPTNDATAQPAAPLADVLQEKSTEPAPAAPPAEQPQVAEQAGISEEAEQRLKDLFNQIKSDPNLELPQEAQEQLGRAINEAQEQNRAALGQAIDDQALGKISRLNTTSVLLEQAEDILAQQRSAAAAGQAQTVSTGQTAADPQTSATADETATAGEQATAGDSQPQNPWLQLITLLFEALTGRKIDEIQQVEASQEQAPAQTAPAEAPAAEAPAPAEAPAAEAPAAEAPAPAAPAEAPAAEAPAAATGNNSSTENSEQDEQKNLMAAKEDLKEALKANVIARTGQAPSTEAIEKEANAAIGSLTSLGENESATLTDEIQGLKNQTAELEKNTQAVTGNLAAVVERAKAEGKSDEEINKEVESARSSMPQETEQLSSKTREASQETLAIENYAESVRKVAVAEGREGSEIESIVANARKESADKDLSELTIANGQKLDAIEAFVGSARTLAEAEGRPFNAAAEKDVRKGLQGKETEAIATDTKNMDTRIQVIEENVAAYKTQLEMTGVIGDEQNAKIAERRTSLAQDSNDYIAAGTEADKEKNTALKALSDKESERADFLIANNLMPEGLTKTQYVDQIMSEAGKRSTAEIKGATEEATTELQDARKKVQSVASNNRAILEAGQAAASLEEDSANGKTADSAAITAERQREGDLLRENRSFMESLLAAAGGITSFKVAGVSGGTESDFALKSPQAIGSAQPVEQGIASAPR